jgi:hypothetical protein
MEAGNAVPRSPMGVAAPQRMMEIVYAAIRRWRRAQGAGLPAATPFEARAGATLGALAVLWMLGVAAWGINGPFGDGHFASTAAIGAGADNMWRYHIVYPVHYFMDSVPSTNNYYMHHPLGVFWVAALFQKLLGAHNWVLRLPAVLYSALSTFFLYRLGRATWGPLEGAISALAFAALPITLGFSSFHALEGPVICGLLVASWGYVRFSQTWRASYAVASLVGFVWALNHDWAAYIWGVVFLSWQFLRIFLLPSRSFGDFNMRALARYWGLMVGAALAVLGVQTALLMKTSKIAELLSMYAVRSSGSTLPLAAVLHARRIWIELMFSGLAIGLGKLALPVVIGRFAWKRDDRELLPLVMLIVAILQYTHFKQGADVHIFWPQYFAPYFAMAMGASLASLRDAIARLAAWLTPPRRQWVARFGAGAATVMIAVPVLMVLKDGASLIRLAHESGGRFISTGIRSDIDRVDAIRWWIPRLAPVDRVAFHPGIVPVHWSLGWEMRPHTLIPHQGLGARGTLPRAYLLDSRFATSAELKQAAKMFQVDAVGCFWFMDRGLSAAPLQGFTLAERNPGPIEWYVHGGTEPIRTVLADAWATWEWRTLLEQSATMPAGVPRTLDQLRIAHNAALAAGNPTAATRLRADLQRRLNLRVGATFDDGTTILGAHHDTDSQHAITLFFLTGRGGFKGRARFKVSAKVEKAPGLSTLPADPEIIEVDQPPPVPTDLWRPGHIYSVTFSYRKRPGRERFSGAFASLDGTRVPARTGDLRPVDIVVLD